MASASQLLKLDRIDDHHVEIAAGTDRFSLSTYCRWARPRRRKYQRSTFDGLRARLSSMDSPALRSLPALDEHCWRVPGKAGCVARTSAGTAVVAGDPQGGAGWTACGGLHAEQQRQQCNKQRRFQQSSFIMKILRKLYDLD
jgi:hypothetical protein